MLAPLLALSAVLAAAPAPIANLAADQAFAAGLSRYRDADFEAAIPLFQRAVMASPDSDGAKKGQAEVWLGLSFLNIGNLPLAKSSFRAALLADPKAALPEEAPPAATPIFANIKGDLERQPAARAAPTEVAAAPPQPDAHAMDSAKPPDVPAARTPAPSPPPEIHPDLTQAAVETPASPHRYPVWVAPAVGGLAVALGGAAVGFKVASNGSFSDAANATVARRAAELSSHADGQQHTARALAFTAAGVAVVAGVLYLLNE